MTSIHIPRDAFEGAIVEFVQTSALRFCTTVERGEFHVVVVPQWDPAGFSSGERALWGVLESLCTGHIRTVLDRCDDSNVRAFVKVVADIAQPLGVSA